MPSDSVSRAEFEALQAEVKSLRAILHVTLLKRMTQAEDTRALRAKRQRETLAELAAAMGVPLKWGSAARIHEVLDGQIDPPPGCARLVGRLLDLYEDAPSQRTIWRALLAQANLAAGITDTSDN